MDLCAQVKSRRVARAAGQSKLIYSWYTDWVTNFHISAQGYDSIVTAEGQDTSQVVLQFDPPGYMLDLYQSRYAITDPLLLRSDRRTFRRIVPSRATKNAVRTLDWVKNYKYEPYHLASISDRLVDSLTFETLFRRDSIFDFEGKLRHLRIDSNYLYEQNGELIWAYSRLETFYSGTPQWLVKSIRTASDQILTRDSSGKEIIRVVPKADQIYTHMGELPAGYRASALKIGPPLEAFKLGDTDEVSILTDLVWRKLPPTETVALLRDPLYVHEGKFLASYVEHRKDKKTAIDDTVERSFDHLDRLISQRYGAERITYKYDGQDRIVEIGISYYALPPDRTVITYEGLAGYDLVEYITKIKSERTREHSFSDTTRTRRIHDIGYPLFDSLRRPIDKIASVTIDGRSVSAMLNELSDVDVSKIRMELFDKRERLLTRSNGKVLSMKKLAPGIYQLRYFYGEDRFYDQTIIIDLE
jgi:hypothetical protein